MQDVNFEAGVWAVVTVPGGRTFIGSIPGINQAQIAEQMLERVPIAIEQSFELISQHMPAQDPESGRVGFQRLVRCAPVNNCVNPARFTSVLVGIHFFSDMQKEDVDAHKTLVTQLEKMLVDARLAAAGIVKPNMQAPSGPLVRP